MEKTYPDIHSEDFYSKLLRKKEFIDNDKEHFCLQPHQKLLSNFINPLTQYSSLLVYHQPGLGKTLTAISIAEKFKKNYKIAVFVKNRILESNFRRELTYSCSSLSLEERKILLSQPSEVEYDAIQIKNELQKKVERQIDAHYSFYTYGGLSIDTPGNRPRSLSNCLIICDEIHNAIGNNIYNSLFGLLEKSYNFKIVLLTATPIFESVSEIFEISNLLNIGQTRNLLPIRSQLLTDKLVKKIPGDSTILNDTVLSLTKLGRDALRKSLKGRVSKLDIPSSSSAFADKIFVGEKASINLSTILFKTKMTILQEKAYKVFNKDDVLFKDSSDISTLVYPDGSFGKTGFEKYIKGNTVVDFLKRSELKNFSPKLYSVLVNLENIKGPAFVYSNYVSFGGTELIAAVLRSNGYTANLSGNSKKKFLVFGESISVAKRQKLLRIFNSKKNINGELIKVIIGSPAVSEGVSFKNIRSIHVLEPHWNLSRIDQIIGRGIRYLSHSSLPQQERNVKIFLHATISSKVSESIDLLKYILSEKKDKAGKIVSRLLQELAFDCSINKKTEPRKIDYSRECDYDKCDYTCDSADIAKTSSSSSSSSSSSRSVDTSTYSLKNHAPETYTFILDHIVKLFATGFVYTSDFIIDSILKKRKNISVEDINLVLREMPSLRSTFINAFSVKGRIVRNHDTFSILPNGSTSEEQFNRMFKKEVINKELPKLRVEKKVRSPKKIKFDKDKVVLGIREGDVFKIVYNPENVKYDDNRKNKTGKVCSSYSKEDLKKMLQTLNINLTTYTKQSMCQALEKYLIK